MKRDDILKWLREEDPSALETLWAEADRVRRENVGDEVHFRGLIEISNHCARRCGYCGLNAGNSSLKRYRMTDGEILESAKDSLRFGYGTVVLQSGEDAAFTKDRIVKIVTDIRRETGLAVTLSLGERTPKEFAAWREAGADRYLLRFETSNPELFAKIHPPSPGKKPVPRLELLRALRDTGYEVGSGVMIGIPGQSYDDLASDIELFKNLELDMIGVGPYIAHPAAPLEALKIPPGEQVPNTELMTYKTVALTRIARPDANIPATTALATLNTKEGRELGLQRGANVIMPNMTPIKYRAMYEIYPGKACAFETSDACAACVKRRVESIKRHPGSGSGASPSFVKRAGKNRTEQ
jgi:biotin synthase